MGTAMPWLGDHAVGSFVWTCIRYKCLDSYIRWDFISITLFVLFNLGTLPDTPEWWVLVVMHLF